MDILYVIGKLDVGGAELHLLNISKELVRKGHEIFIFPLKRGGVLENKFLENGVQIIGGNCTNLGKIGLFISSIQFIHHLHKYRHDVIHFFLPEAYVIGTICTFFSPDIKRIMSRRSLNLYQNRMFFIGAIEKYLHKKMDMVLGNSKAVCNELKQEEIPEHKLKLIYNGLNIKKYSATNVLKTSFASLLCKTEITLLCVANLIPYKGHEDLLTALNLIKNDVNNDWKLILAGRDDGYGEYLKKITKKFNIENHVEFLGVVDDIPELIKQSDIGLLCSHQEGFSNSILECMAGGLPMIVTNVGGNAEAVIEGETGFVVKPNHPEEIGRAILKLIKNEKYRNEMGEASQKRISANFSLGKCVQLYEDVYSEMIDIKVL